MAGSSSSSNHGSSFINEKLVSFNSSADGPAEVLRLGDPPVPRKAAEGSSLMGQVNITYKRKRKRKAINNGVETTFIECGCCYWPNLFENLLQCRNGHWFCFKCIKKQVDQIIYGGLKADDYLSCMDIDGCNEAIPLSEIKRALPNDVIERYERCQAQQAVVEAKIEGLVYCPFCNIPYEIDECAQVLDCPNPKCLIASCIQCKKLSHSPLRCEEVDKNSETALRVAVEERMTKAVIRECNICHAELIKTSGCNKVRCKCGNIMCYICTQTVSCSDQLPHFCNCVRYSGNPPGKPCQVCNRCSYIENEMEDNEALDAREEALKEFADKKPELLDVEIGPPLKRQLRPQHPVEQQWEHIQRLPAHGGDRPQFLRFGEQLRNMALRPAEFFTFGNQMPIMALPAILRPALPHPEFLRSGYQVAPPPDNGDAPLPAPHFFRFGDAPLPAPHFFRFGDAPLPAPHFFRFGDGEQLANRFVPQPQIFRHDSHLANMLVPQVDAQLAHSDLEEQEDWP